MTQDKTATSDTESSGTAGANNNKSTKGLM